MVELPTVGWAFPHQALMKKMIQRFVRRTIGRGSLSEVPSPQVTIVGAKLTNYPARLYRLKIQWPGKVWHPVLVRKSWDLLNLDFMGPIMKSKSSHIYTGLIHKCLCPVLLRIEIGPWNLYIGQLREIAEWRVHSKNVSCPFSGMQEKKRSWATQN